MSVVVEYHELCYTLVGLIDFPNFTKFDLMIKCAQFNVRVPIGTEAIVHEERQQ